MTRLVIHAGFHKTGTTSVQSMIRENHALLSRHLRPYLKPDFEDLSAATRAFSAKPGSQRLTRVGDAAAEFFASLDPDDPRPVLMSSEDLSGHLPGRRGIDRYDCVPLLMDQIAVAAAETFGDDVDPRFFFSTRAATEWLRSVWWQNLRSIRLTESLEAYTSTLAEAADLDAVLTDVKSTVAPAKVASCSLEDSAGMPLGPLSPLLALAGLSAADCAGLSLLPPENRQPDAGLAEVFLALNRSGLPDKSVAEAKKSLRRMAERHADQG